MCCFPNFPLYKYNFSLIYINVHVESIPQYILFHQMMFVGLWDKLEAVYMHVTIMYIKKSYAGTGSVINQSCQMFVFLIDGTTVQSLTLSVVQISA